MSILTLIWIYLVFTLTKPVCIPLILTLNYFSRGPNPLFFILFRIEHHTQDLQVVLPNLVSPEVLMFVSLLYQGLP